MFQLVPDLAADWNSTGHEDPGSTQCEYTVSVQSVDFGPISDQFYFYRNRLRRHGSRHGGERLGLLHLRSDFQAQKNLKLLS